MKNSAKQLKQIYCDEGKYEFVHSEELNRPLCIQFDYMNILYSVSV